MPTDWFHARDRFIDNLVSMPDQPPPTIEDSTKEGRLAVFRGKSNENSPPYGVDGLIWSWARITLLVLAAIALFSLTSHAVLGITGAFLLLGGFAYAVG